MTLRNARCNDEDRQNCSFVLYLNLHIFDCKLKDKDKGVCTVTDSVIT